MGRWLLMVCVLSACGDEESAMGVSVGEEGPHVVETSPEHRDGDVDPDITEITATFDREMRDGNWSWAYSDIDDFPEMTGDPYFEDDMRTAVMPVTLESGRRYVIWINSLDFMNFKDVEGEAARPYNLVFTTR